MKNIKRFYQEHRIFTILMAVVLVCMVLIITVLVQCFYVGDSNKYGNRLEGIENYKISTSRQKDFENNIANNEKVQSVDIKITGKIIYITMQIEPNVALVEAESIAQKSLEAFSEEEQSFYDINITLKQNSSEKSDGFIISGAKNKNGVGLVWNNNRQVTDQVANDTATEKEN